MKNDYRSLCITGVEPGAGLHAIIGAGRDGFISSARVTRIVYGAGFKKLTKDGSSPPVRQSRVEASDNAAPMEVVGAREVNVAPVILE